MPSVSSKAGEHEVKGGGPEDVFASEVPRTTINRIAGDITIEDPAGRTYVLRPTFAAALEIEDTLGIGVEAMRVKMAGSGLPGMPSATTRELGVVIAAGIRAAGEARATPEKCAKIAFECGRKALRQPLGDFLFSLCEGGRGRADDLGKGESPNGSLDAEEEAANELIKDLASRSGSI